VLVLTEINGNYAAISSEGDPTRAKSPNS